MDITQLTQRLAGKTLKGVSFPAVIHNGSYFLTDLGVYEDGVVECWGGVDLYLFRRKVASGWVKTAIPEGATLNVHHLAHMTVSDAEWLMTPDSLIDRVEATVTALNPARTNLMDMEGDDTDRTGPVGVAKAYRGGDFTWRDGGNTVKVGGVAKWAFWRGEDRVHVVKLCLFEDDAVRINGAGEAITLTLDDLRSDDRLCTAQPGDRIEITGLCRFTATTVDFTIPTEDLLAEIEIDRDRKLGKETPLQRTQSAFKAYLEDPTRAHLQVLREAYESVPEHLRIYCGNMDEKDIPIRIALYGEQEIEGWSHYAASKARGLDLPRITVPKPKD